MNFLTFLRSSEHNAAPPPAVCARRQRKRSGLPTNFLFALALLLTSLLGVTAEALAQSASLLPPGMQQFSDGNGNPIAGGSLSFYVPGTSTAKATWLDAFQANLNPNPLTLDANGRAIVFGSGAYREVLKDAAGNVIWDQLTYSPATSGGSSGGGLPNAIASGTANDLTASITGFSLTAGTAFSLKASANNTGTTTLNVSGSGRTNLLKQSNTGVTALVANDLVLGQEYLIIYDGTQYELLNPSNGSGSNLVAGPGASTNGFVPQWNGTSGALLGTGLQVGIVASGLVQFNASSQYPAADGSLIKNIVLPSYVGGLALSNDGVSPNTVIDTSAGTATSSDQTTAMALVTISKSLSSWVVGSGNGCLDTGSVTSSSWYHVYVIERTDTGIVDELCSKNATSPTMPSGYTKRRRIGSFKTDGSSHILAFTQIGSGNVRENYWATAVQDISATSVPTGAATNLTLASVPSGIKVDAIFDGQIDNATLGTSAAFFSLDTADPPPLANIVSFGTGKPGYGHFVIRTNTSQQIRANTGNSGSTVGVSTIGWYDYL